MSEANYSGTLVRRVHMEFAIGVQDTGVVVPDLQFHSREKDGGPMVALVWALPDGSNEIYVLDGERRRALAGLLLDVDRPQIALADASDLRKLPAVDRNGAGA